MSRVRTTSVFVAVAMLVVGLMGPATAVRRVQGDSRIRTAVEVSERYFGSADTVVVARADGFADALAGASLAGVRGASMLFVDRDEVPSEVLREIDRLGATTVIALGGTQAISEAVVRRLGAQRIAGADRYATAAAIAAAVDRRRAAQDVFLVTGEGFADAVAVAALAAKLRAPILLTARDTLPRATREALESIDPARVRVVGGTNVIRESVLDDVRGLGFTVAPRLAGPTRYDTSAQIVAASIDAGMRSTHRIVVSGEGYADALAAAPAAGLTNRVLALAPRINVGPSPLALHDGCTIDEIEVVGGEGAISATVVERLARAEAGDCSGDPGPNEPWYSDVVASRLDEALDARRAQYGRQPVVRAGDLDAIARDWSLRMARDGQLRHNSDLADQACCYDRLGENVGRYAYAGGVVTADHLAAIADSLHRTWLSSATHRQNLDDTGWDDIGVGIVVRGDTVWATVVFREQG